MIYKNYGYKQCPSSPRVVEAAVAGGHICIMPFSSFQQMVKHPLTDLAVKRFLADWNAQLHE